MSRTVLESNPEAHHTRANRHWVRSRRVAAPSAEQENEFIRLHGIGEYGKWHLGVDDEMREDTKGHYKFPYGDFKNVHRCAVLSAESRAGQYKHLDIESAAAHLRGMMETVKAKASG